MRAEVTKLVQSCDLCQKSKAPNVNYKGYMQPIITKNIGELVAFDFFGPIPATRYGFKFIFVVIDIFSKFVQIYPLRRATTNGALKALEKFNEIVHIKTVLSDHGSQFTSRRWRAQLESQGVEVTFCSVYHPASNPAERVMRELGRLLRAHCHRKQNQWYNYVEYFNKLLNAVPHETISISPFELIFKKSPDFPVDELIQKVFPTLKPNSLNSSLTRVREMHLTRAEKRKKAYDRFVKNSPVKLGDLVLLKTHYLSKAKEVYASKCNIPSDIYPISPDSGTICKCLISF